MTNKHKLNSFEQAFTDYLNGDKKAEVIVHNNKGDDEHMRVHYFFRSFDEMPELEQIALENCTGKVLDIGAGSGSHALHLQEKGLDATALDIRPGFCEVMKKRGVKKVVLSDIFDYRGDKFDTLLMMMNGIGFSKNFAGLTKFFQQAKTLLKPGGQLLLDSSDLLYLYEEDDGSFKIDLNNEYYGEVEYQVEYKGILEEPFKWLFVDYGNLFHYAEQAGLKGEILFEDDHYNYLARLGV
jgi:SAM-dependent methyltransferase